MPFFITSLCNKFLFAADKIAPNGRNAAQVFYNLFDCLNRIIDLFLGIFLRQTEAKRAVCYIVDSTDSKKHVAWVERAGGTRRARRSIYALIVKKQQQGFPLNALKAEIDVTGKSLLGVTVEDRMGYLGKSRNKLGAQGC